MIVKINKKIYFWKFEPDRGSVWSLFQTEWSLDQTGPDWTINNPSLHATFSDSLLFELFLFVLPRIVS